MRVFATLDELVPLVGQHVATSDWITVTQEQIDLFAEATGDHQWLHVDPVRAKAGPYGTTIAHGFLTLSLLPIMYATAIKVEQMRMGLNYGMNRVRFPAPVPVGSRLRCRIKLLACEEVADNGLQLTWDMNVEREGETKPVCIAEFVQRRYR
ncbi:putative enoyl-CoA hydratase 1 [Variovorax sp. SRS16]|uniref:MaoC family dehydratase n=1 Tax=Variovorax sp. SRS16 TaxID=282217 RepID=UPI001317EF12|nr:MaoC family dehydratase [Variovorax sp. SRS16]VTU29835.1 putative enoyl-CoA hydratase 1 [Variovorax sp. SRS16]